MVEVVEVTGVLNFQDGTAMTGGRISFKLSGIDMDDGVLVDSLTQTVELTETGTFAISVWPNSRGERGRTYEVSYARAGQTSLTKLISGVVVSDTSGQTLSDLIDLTNAATALRAFHYEILSQADYDARVLADTLVDGLYFIEVM